MLDLIKNLFDENPKTLKRLQKTVNKINALSDDMAALDDEPLAAKTGEFKDRHDKGENIDKLLPEAFAVAREVADRRCRPGGNWSIFYWDDEEIKQKISDADILDTIRDVKKRIRDGEDPNSIFLPTSF